MSFLASRHGCPVTDLEALHGGFWSSAFAYRVHGRELVVRFGSIREGFEMDRMAMAFDRPDLPVPAVLEVGDVFGGAYAISMRHHGRFLENVRPEEASVVGPTIVRLLAALRAIPVEDGVPVAWQPDGPAAESTWRRWLSDSLLDDPRQVVSGWRATLAADTGLDRLFTACEARVRTLSDACPERRDVLHGDLLNSNVLISDDARHIAAVFSWKCSQRGDFLFDTAWCTFWGAFHPGIAAADVFGGVLSDPSMAADAEALAQAPVRHHCYELQIGASHLGWNAWVGDHDALRSVATHTAMVLERGPLGPGVAGVGA